MAARSTHSECRKTCSQTSRPQMRTDQKAKKQRMLSTRMRLIGVTIPARDTEDGMGGETEGLFTAANSLPTKINESRARPAQMRPRPGPEHSRRQRRQDERPVQGAGR